MKLLITLALAVSTRALAVSDCAATNEGDIVQSGDPPVWTGTCNAPQTGDSGADGSGGNVCKHVFCRGYHSDVFRSRNHVSTNPAVNGQPLPHAIHIFHVSNNANGVELLAHGPRDENYPAECTDTGKTAACVASTPHNHKCKYNEGSGECTCTCAPNCPEGYTCDENGVKTGCASGYTGYPTTCQQAPAVGLGGATESCPTYGTADASYGCPFKGLPKMGGYSQNQHGTSTFTTAGFMVPKGHYLRVRAACRQGGCNADLIRTSIDVGSDFGSCTGNCGTGPTDLCGTSMGSGTKIGPHSGGSLGIATVWGPFGSDTQLTSHGEAKNGFCADNYIADSWGYYQTAQCFEDAHCATGSCVANVCTTA